MEFSAIENLGNANLAAQKPSKQDAIQRAAEQFEAILLMQLTSTLNGIGGGEDSLFGKDGGSDLAQKMFSEQLATAMAEAGGIGLKDIILRQFGLNKSDSKNTNSQNNTSLSKAISAVKDITENGFTKNKINKNIDVANLINRNGKTNPVRDNFASLKSGEAEIISLDSEKNSNEDWRTAFTGEKKKERLYVPQSIINEILSPNKAAKNKTNSNTIEMPVDGRITSKFGNRFHPIDKKVKFHSGIDIYAKRGTPIRAAADGIVVFAGKRGGYGNMVIIDHGNGRTSRYAHADKIFVERGQPIEGGKPIATVGSTGKATGPHLHFEFRENGKAVNPLKLISNVLPKNADR